MIRVLNKFFTIFKKFLNYVNTTSLISSIQNKGKGNYFDDNITINRPNNLKIGDNNYLGKNLYLIAHGKIEIGNNCSIAADCKFITRNHVFENKNVPINEQTYDYKSIKIGDDCWFGYNVIVLPGVILGKGCVVAAGSVVTKSFEDYSIIAGVPARLIKERK
tara:strand:+ start:7170 stop:7655 length:486 start_codon:yes stop_codon:yes gene_type:complete